MTETPSTSPLWKPPPFIFWWSLCSTLTLCIVMAAYTVRLTHPEWNSKGSPAPTLGEVVFIYVTLASMALIYIYLLLYGVITGLRIAAGKIDYRTVFGRQALELADIERVVWRATHIKPTLRTANFTVEVQGKERRMAIHLGHFPPQAQPVILEALRNLFHNLPQIGWDEFIEARTQLTPLAPHKPTPLPNSDTRLWQMGLAVLLGGLLAWAMDARRFQMGQALDAYSPRIIFTISLVAGMGAASILLLSLWEMIRYRFTLRALLAVLLSASGLAVSIMVMYTEVQAIITRIFNP